MRVLRSRMAIHTSAELSIGWLGWAPCSRGAGHLVVAVGTYTAGHRGPGSCGTLGSAPRSSRNLTMSMCPPLAALASSVPP
jgi:hypothetical protein